MVAALFAAVAVSTGCTDSAKQRQPSNGQAATATATAQRQQQQLEYIVTKAFTAAEFEKWVDDLERHIAEVTGVAAEERSLEAAIKTASGRAVRIELVQSIEPQGIIDPSPAYQQAVREIGGRYISLTDTILIKQKALLARIEDFAQKPGFASVTKFHYKLHELYHNLSDMHSVVDPIDTLIVQHGLNYVQAEVNGLPVLLIVPEGFDKGKSKMQGYTFTGKLLFDSAVPEADAKALLSAYKNGASVEEAEQELGVKLTDIFTTQTARRVITEAQAYFAQPLADELRADKLELQVSVLSAVPQQKGPHVEYAKKAVDDVVRGYAALKKAGVTGTEANIRMAVLVGKSMTISQDEFEPYERLRENVSALIAQLKVGEPARAEISDLLLQRKKHHEGLNKKMADSLADYIISSVVWPFVSPKLPKEFGGVANILPTRSFRFEETSSGMYAFSTSVIATKVR